MTELAIQILSRLAVASLFLFVTGVGAIVVLRAFRCRSPFAHTAAWCLVLAQGILVFQFPISFACYALPVTAEPVAETTRAQPPLPHARITERDIPGVTSQRLPSVMVWSGAPSENGQQRSSWKWPVGALLVWLAGVLYFAATWGVTYARFIRNTPCAECDLDEWNQEWRTILQATGISQPIQLCVSRSVGPALCRWPTEYRIVVPFEPWQKLTKEQRQSILRHELAHYERRDLCKTFIIHLLALPHWFNPMAWFAVRRFEESIEWACDDLVVAAGRKWSTNYAKALLALGEYTVPRTAWAAAIGGGLPGRIRRVLMPDRQPDSRPRVYLTIGLLLLLLVLHVVRVELVAQEPDTSAAESAPAEPTDAVAASKADNIIAGLKQSEAAIRTLTVTMECRELNERSAEEIQSSVKKFGSEPVIRSESRFTEQWVVDSTGRGWNKSSGVANLTKLDGTHVQRPFERETTSDGEVNRSLESDWQSGFVPVGAIGSGSGLTGYGMSPFDFTVNFLGQRVSAILDQQGCIAVGQQDWRETTYEIIETPPIAGNNSVAKYQFWVDPQRGYLVTRFRHYGRNATSNQWQLTHGFDAMDHDEIVQGIWLPKRMKSTGYRVFDATCWNWSVNDDIPESRLQLVFPTGIKIHGLREHLKAQTDVSQNFFVAPVTTDFQRWHLRLCEDVVAYAGIDGMSFIDRNTGNINTDRFDFKALRTALKEVRKECAPGTLWMSVDYGNVDTSGEVTTFARAALIQIGEQAGFENVKFTSGASGGAASHEWIGLPHDRETDRDEPRLGNGAVIIFPIATALSGHFTGAVDCYIEIPQELPLDADRMVSEADREVIRDVVGAMDLPEDAATSIRVVVEEPEDKNMLFQHPLGKQGSGLHLDVVNFLKSLGFEEIKIMIGVDYWAIPRSYK